MLSSGMNCMHLLHILLAFIIFRAQERHAPDSGRLPQYHFARPGESMAVWDASTNNSTHKPASQIIEQKSTTVGEIKGCAPAFDDLPIQLKTTANLRGPPSLCWETRLNATCTEPNEGCQKCSSSYSCEAWNCCGDCRCLKACLTISSRDSTCPLLSQPV